MFSFYFHGLDYYPKFKKTNKVVTNLSQNIFSVNLAAKSGSFYKIILDYFLQFRY